MNPIPLLESTDCRAQLIWGYSGEVQAKHLCMRASFEPTVCWRILRGGLHFQSGEKSWNVKAGEWFFPSGGMATQRFTKGTRLLSLRFLFLFPGGTDIYPREQSLRFGADAFPELETRAFSLIRALEPWKGRGTLMVGRNRIPLDENFKIEALFYQWLAEYIRVMQEMGQTIRSREQGDPRVAEALQRLEQGGFRKGFSESELAAACGLSVNQLVLLFKRENGRTPLQYFDRLRLEHARQALAQSSMQIKEIAYELGFSSSPHFTNWFKQRQRKSPRDFRKQALGQV